MEEREYRNLLNSAVKKYSEDLKGLFGPFDSRFKFGTVRKCECKDHRPHTHFPHNYHLNEDCVVDMHVTWKPWDHRWCNQGLWQVAHECVHLIDPVEKGCATFLEEGLAAWFQDELEYHKAVVKAYIPRAREGTAEIYKSAKGLVQVCDTQKLTQAIRELRVPGVKGISKISLEDLSNRLPNVDKETLEKLCSPFPVQTRETIGC